MARVAVTSGVCTAALLVGAAPASATPTTQNMTREVLSFGQEQVAVCAGGEQITLGFELVRNRHLHHRDGVLVREARNVNYTSIFRNEATGEVVTSQGTRNIVLDFAAGTFSSRGNYRTVTQPGEGAVLHFTGQYVEDLEVEGLLLKDSGPRNDEFAPGGTAAVCGLFGLEA